VGGVKLDPLLKAESIQTGLSPYNVGTLSGVSPGVSVGDLVLGKAQKPGASAKLNITNLGTKLQR